MIVSLLVDGGDRGAAGRRQKLPHVLARDGSRHSVMPGRGAGRSLKRDPITLLTPDLGAIAGMQDRSQRPSSPRWAQPHFHAPEMCAARAADLSSRRGWLSFPRTSSALPVAAAAVKVFLAVQGVGGE
jgi:hypothetical protein